jgi:hypothetical protein
MSSMVETKKGMGILSLYYFDPLMLMKMAVIGVHLPVVPLHPPPFRHRDPPNLPPPIRLDS